MAILLSGDTFVNTASPRKFHFILESLKLRSARVQFLRVVRNRFQQTNPFTVFLGCNRNKNQLGFFFLARRSNKKKPRVYKTDNNGKIDSSLKQLKIVFWQKMLTWSTTALCDFILREFLAAFFWFLKIFFFQAVAAFPSLLGGSCLAILALTDKEMNLCYTTCPYHQPHFKRHFPCCPTGIHSSLSDKFFELCILHFFMLKKSKKERNCKFICIRFCNQVSKIYLWTLRQFLQVRGFFEVAL